MKVILYLQARFGQGYLINQADESIKQIGGLRMKRLRKALSFLLIIVMTMTSVQLSGISETLQVSAAENAAYEIYPTPHDVEYPDGSFTLSDEVNVIFGEGIDQATKDKVDDVLKTAGVTHVVTDATVQGKTNLLVGIHRSEGAKDAADQFAAEHTAVSDDHFNQTDAYVLTAQDNTIAAVGKDTNAAFYALSTLKMVLRQITGKQLQNFTVTDFSDTGLRGFIEGYYGLPWSNEDRMNLMKFGGEIKCNAYVFAPKDDPYHNSKWREMYPEEKLAEIREMAEVGRKSKCEFVWTIHPFMSDRITESNYDDSLATIKKKFQQLYDAGVRRFGVLADDAGGVSVNLIANLLNDLTDWCKSKNDVGDILYCPPEYNWAFAGYSWTNLRNANQLVNDDVDFFWTGQSVCGHVTKETVDGFVNGLTSDAKAGRKPLFWLNWPVNDINKVRMLMGKGEMLNTDVTNLAGVITNPMQQSEPSKVAIFAVADYAWNIQGFNRDKSWADSFKYVEPDASQALHTMAKHLSDPAPNGHSLVLGESEELAPLLEEFMTLYQSGATIQEKGSRLVEEFQKIADAADAFERDSQNENLKAQLSPWTDSLRYLAKAAINYINTAIAYENNDYENVWSYFSEASSYYGLSKQCPVVNIDSVPNVEAGAKRLIPFVKNMSDVLGPKVNSVVNPNADKTRPFVPLDAELMKSDGINGTYNEYTEGKATDKDDTTFAWFKTTPNDSFPAGGWLGLDLGREVTLGTIKYLQGGTTTAQSDLISSAVLEYSLDGENYTELESYKDKRDIYFNAEELGIKARYVRVRAKAATGKWLAVREFAVSEGEVLPSTVAYTNVASLSRRSVTTTADTADLSVNDRDLTLGKNQYLGIMLPRIRNIMEINAAYTQQNKLTMEASVNGTEWQTVDPGNLTGGLDARYIRLINSSKDPVTFQLSRFTIRSKEIAAPQFRESNIAASAITNGDQAVDGDRSTKANFSVSQKEGQYIIYDLGQTIPLKKLKMVQHDSEVDFIRNGKISVSADLENWTDILTIGNPDKDPGQVTIDECFPDHEISYYTLSTAEPVNQDTRYIKISVTKDYNARWIRFNELEINDNEYIPVENNPSFVTTDVEEKGHRPSYLTDNDVSTTYRSSKKEGEGSLTYRVSGNTNVTGITILQSPNTISDADVSVRYGNDAWKSIGTLDKSLNVFEDLGQDVSNVFEIKISWSQTAPELHEMYLVTAEPDPVIPADKSSLIEKYTQALAVDGKYYTKETYAALKNAIDDAEGVIGYAEASQEEVAAALAALTDAFEKLEDIPADRTELQGAVDKAKELDAKLYTEESYQAVTQAVAAAEESLGKEGVKQKELDEKLAALEQAVNNLVIKGTLTKIESGELSATAGSQEGSGSDGNADQAIDGNETTYWHSNWSGSAAVKPDIPGNVRNEFTIDVGKNRILRKLEYVPRSNNINGRILGYKLYYSPTENGDDFREVPGGTGTWSDNADKKEVVFNTVNARRIQIRATSTRGDSGNDKFISAAEFYVYEIIPDEEEQIYHVTFEGGEGTVGEAPESMTAKEGEQITLPDNTYTREGFTFTGWADGDEIYQPGDSYTVPSYDVIFTAQWQEVIPEIYTISFEGGEGALGDAPVSITGEEGAPITLPDNTFVKAGFAFNGWNDGNGIYQPGDTYHIPGMDTVFTAEWIIDVPETEVTAYFEGGDGAAGESPEPVTVLAGSSFILPENSYTRDGFVFQGWNDGMNTYQPGSEYRLIQDITFTAVWGKKPIPTYVVSFHGNGGNTSTSGITVNEGSVISVLPTAARSGYQFLGWFTAADGGAQFTSSTRVTANITVYAHWKQIVEVPAKVTGLKTSYNKIKSIKITWEKAAKAKGYHVYRYDSRRNEWKKIKTTTSTSYKNTGLKEGTNYSYRVKAYNQIGSEVKEGSFSDTLKTASAPAKPSLKVSQTGSKKVKITWKKTSRCDGVEIYMKAENKKKYTKIASKSKSASSLKKSGLKKGTTYRFKIKRYKRAGSKKIYSSYSSVKKIKINNK